VTAYGDGVSGPPSATGFRWPGLTAKFLAPHLPPHHVTRQRLDVLIAPPEARVSVVVGPPGAGKTVLVREWIAAHPEVRVAWIALEESDSSPLRFWTVVVHALRAVDERIGVEASGRLLEEEEVADDVLAGLLADVEQWAETPVVVVLEDYHVLRNDRVHEQVAWLLEHRPATLRVVITSRADPLLPLGRWRVRGELAEVRAADLRFDEAETESLLAGFAGVDLDASERRALQERTEGWAAGLQLAALALQRAEDASGFVARFDGTERTVSEFLFQEVLQRQPEDVRLFLLRTSLLDSLTGPLCDAVTGGSGGAAMLQRLEAAQLFVVRLDPPGEWFRYHRLFSDRLRSELRSTDPDAMRSVHERAAAWCEANDLPGTAVQHARATADVDLVLPIIARNAGALWARGFNDLIVESLASIPASVVEADAVRALDYAYSLGLAGWVKEALAWVDRIEDRISVDDPLRYFISAARAIAAGSRGAASEFSDRYEPISRDLGATVPYPDAIAFARLFCQRMHTLTEQPDIERAAYLDTVSTVSTAAVVRNGAPEGALAEGLAVEGRLREAATEAERSLAVWNHEAVTLVPAVCDALRASARVRIEAGDLAEAERLVESGLPVAEAQDSVYQVVMCAGVLAEIARARGGAQVAMDRVVASSRRLRGVEPGPELRGCLAEVAVRAALDVGDVGAAARFGKEVRFAPSAATVGTRLALARGDHDAARDLLDSYEPPTLRRAVERELLAARLALGGADEQRALRHVAGAVELSGGEPLGWTFAQERDLRALYADPSLAGRVPPFALTPSPAPPTASRHVAELVEQLSERELRVLHLLPTHLSNQEIAGELYVSLNTVKTHLKSVYRKLGVSSRSGAVAAGRAVGLLP
jgi:LuxR family transcriptional regulator, maltose regulon positive regulatory protein